MAATLSAARSAAQAGAQVLHVPGTVKVKKGEHTFSVTSTDAGGNTGAAATDSFTVKRRKKK